jgi:hypothetical protein
MIGRDGHGDVAVLAVDAAEAVERGARRAPDRGRGSFRDGLEPGRPPGCRDDGLGLVRRHVTAEVRVDDRAGMVAPPTINATIARRLAAGDTAPPTTNGQIR